MSATERAEYHRSVSDRESGGGQNFVHTRNPDGTVTIKERTTGNTVQGEPSATDGGQAQAAADKVKIREMEVTQAEPQEFFQSKADAELRTASLPASPADYTATLPEGFKLPPGVDLKINEADPAFVDARAWAHKQEFSQGQFSEMLSLQAAMQAREIAQFNTAAAAEVQKLGANGSMRVTAIENFLRGHLGDDLASGMRPMLVTAKIIERFERLANKFQSQGAASFSQQHREPAERSGRVSDEQYNAMGPAERLNYARSHDQSQFAGKSS